MSQATHPPSDKFVTLTDRPLAGKGLLVRFDCMRMVYLKNGDVVGFTESNGVYGFSADDIMWVYE